MNRAAFALTRLHPQQFLVAATAVPQCPTTCMGHATNCKQMAYGVFHKQKRRFRKNFFSRIVPACVSS
jgi:hypothetical protein